MTKEELKQAKNKEKALEFQQRMKEAKQKKKELIQQSKETYKSSNEPILVSVIEPEIIQSTQIQSTQTQSAQTQSAQEVSIFDKYRHYIKQANANYLRGLTHAEAMEIHRYCEKVLNRSMGLDTSCGKCMIDRVKMFASLEKK